MKRLRRWFRWAVYLSVPVVPIVILGIYCGPHWYRDAWIRNEMSKECHPVWRDLENGRVGAGQSVDEVIQKTSPTRILRYGAYTQLTYHQPPVNPDLLYMTSVTILAKDGRLVHAGAGSCTWHRIFFDKMSPQVKEDEELSWRTYLEERRREQMGVGLKQGP